MVMVVRINNVLYDASAVSAYTSHRFTSDRYSTATRLRWPWLKMHLVIAKMLSVRKVVIIDLDRI